MEKEIKQKTKKTRVTRKENQTEKPINKFGPIFTENFDINEGEEISTYEVFVKKPTRSQIQEADMYYSIQLNKYIKMGLLTSEQLAKRHIDVGGTFSDQQQKDFAEIQSVLANKQEMLLRILSKENISDSEEERKKKLLKDIAILKSQASEYEYIKNQAYEHTANTKARNDVILWLILNLTHFKKIEENNEDSKSQEMFPGENIDLKKLSLEEKEDSEDKLVEKCFLTIIKAVTIWYWMGVQDESRIKELIKDSK